MYFNPYDSDNSAVLCNHAVYCPAVAYSNSNDQQTPAVPLSHQGTYFDLQDGQANDIFWRTDKHAHRELASSNIFVCQLWAGKSCFYCLYRLWWLKILLLFVSQNRPRALKSRYWFSTLEPEGIRKDARACTFPYELRLENAKCDLEETKDNILGKWPYSEAFFPALIVNKVMLWWLNVFTVPEEVTHRLWHAVSYVTPYVTYIVLCYTVSHIHIFQKNFLYVWHRFCLFFRIVIYFCYC